MAPSSLVKLGSSSLLLASAFSFVVAGCTTDAASGEAAAAEGELTQAAERIAPGDYKLYGAPGAAPDPRCDLYTALSLKNEADGPRALLWNTVGGSCEIAAVPDFREYRLTFDGLSCGSSIFKAERTIDGKRRSITITDHRTRTCRDIVEARIIVEEIDEDGTQRTLYSYDGIPEQPEPATTWLTYAPKQCGANPWHGAQPAPGQRRSYLAGEAGEVDVFFRNRGIELEMIGFAQAAEPRFVCAACSCPRGDQLIVRAKSHADAHVLVSEFGFAPLTDAFVTAPTQCGTNPWERASSGDDELRQLTSWAAGAGAPLSWAAFLDYTEPRFVCMACSCPRGDTAVVIPQDAAAGNQLESLGWKRVEN